MATQHSPLHPYVVDSNFFLQAYKIHYPFDVTPGFWLKTRDFASRGRIISIDKVHDELYTNTDALTRWIDANCPGDFFKDTNPILSAYALVCTWADSRSSHYSPGALATFLQAGEADAFLVSYALANRLTIITQETSDPNRKSVIKIPDACIHFKVPYMTTIEMFRSMGETF